MIKFKVMTVRNFLSIGNITQSIRFDRNDLTLILGQNLDLGGDDSGAKNGVGKCVCVNTLIKVRNTLTGEIYETTIGELYNVALEKQSRG